MRLRPHPARVAAFLVAALLAGVPAAQERQPSPGPGAPDPGAPLPDEATFFARARERLASNERLQARYRYIERSTELNFNVFGRMGSGARQTFEVYPSPVRRMTYRRLLERDGQPIPPAQIAAQDRAFLARLDDYRKALAREGANERDARERRARERQLRERAQVDEATRIFTFKIERREQIGPHRAVVVSFTPKPGMRPQSREARVAYAFVGQAWVHEDEYELIRLEAEAKDDVSFGWGMIAKLNEGMKVLVTRVRLPDGTWVPERSHFKGEGRALMLRKVTVDDLREYSGYAPFEPERIREFLEQ
jgi:hypothetical protein